MNDTTREPSTSLTNATLGADAPLTERAPRSEKTQAARAALENGSAGRLRHLASFAFAVLWLGALGGYLWGFYGKTDAPLPGPSTIALALGIAFVPIFIVAVLVELAAQTRRVARLTRHFAKAALRVSDIEAQMGTGAAQAALAIRRELNALSGALDATLARVAAVEEMLDNQVGAIERVGNQAQLRTQSIRELLQAERAQLSSAAEELGRSTETIAQTLGSHVAAARQATVRGADEMRAAEAALSRQVESFTQATAEMGRKTGDKLEEIKGASQALEDAARQSLASADGLATRLGEEHTMLSSAAENLEAMSGQLDTVLGAARNLVERVERSVDEVVQRIGTSMNEAGARVDDALEGARARAAEAGQNLRAEAEAATAAGSTAAQAIETAAGTARRAAEEMRASVGSEVTALSGMLSGGTRSLDEAATTVTRSVTGAGDAARALIGSLEETLRTVESASARLFGVLDSITQRSSSARSTLDDASREMEDRLAHLPELAAEHAARLSALLEDQASRMNALAEAFGARARAKPGPRLSLRGIAEAPAHDVAETPALAEVPRPVTQAAPAELPPLAAAPQADKDESAPAGGSVRRFSLLRRRETSEAEERHVPQTQTAEQEAEGTTGGFWGALFSRIEGDASAGRTPISVPSNPDEELIPRHDFESTALAVVEGLHALAIDLDRLLEEEPPQELWKRYRSGERNVFARRLLTLKGQGLEERIRHKYNDDIEFREHTDHYVERFEELLDRAREHDRERILEDTYLSSHTGRLYQLLKDAVGG